MFKTAARYLSGVSVFLGDDITRRDIDGELVMFIGQATKGPREPVVINSVDSATSLYGTNNPLVKAMHQYWDGYLDSAQDVPIRLVALRVGGVTAKVITSLGVTLETADAYDGIENDFYVYINNDSTTPELKIWDKLKLPVYDSTSGLDTGHVIVTGELSKTGTTLGKPQFYGKDIANDPNDTPITLAELALLDVENPGGLAATTVTTLNAAATNVVVVETTQAILDGIPALGGQVELSAKVGAVTYRKVITYTSFDEATREIRFAAGTFDVADNIAIALVTGATVSIKLVGASIQDGDSELALTKKAKYEYFRKALPEIEQYTPDYIIPGGVTINETDTISTVFTRTTPLTLDYIADALAITVDAAATWPSTGTVSVDQGLVTAAAGAFGAGDAVLAQAQYSAIAVDGVDYTLTIKQPALAANSAAIAGATVIEVKAGTDTLADITSEGFLKIGASYFYFKEDAASSDTLQKTLNIQLFDEATNLPDAGTDAYGILTTSPVAENDVVTFVLPLASALGTTVSNTWSEDVALPLGIGYVKETETGGDITFEWSASGTKEAGYELAHFGYLIAKFCNDAAVGYNIPLSGMNVTMPTGTTRSDIIDWIGSFPVVNDIAGGVTAITSNGTGLLGDPAIVGSLAYNRIYMTDAASGIFADPALGFLLTDTGFIDGHEVKDSYGEVVDLGKFLCAGAGILTFRHKASAAAYNDTCGIYAIGLLSGQPKNEGISFARIGTGSSVSVGVVVNRKYYNDLAKAGYIVTTREKGLGWVINNNPSAAREDSGYYLISTTRLIKTVVEEKREILVGFIGKPVNRYVFEAARTKLADSFKNDVSKGYLKGFTFDLQVAAAAKAIGRLYLKCSLNPPLELTQVDIDTVIDRDVTSVQ